MRTDCRRKVVALSHSAPYPRQGLMTVGAEWTLMKYPWEMPGSRSDYSNQSLRAGQGRGRLASNQGLRLQEGSHDGPPCCAKATLTQKIICECGWGDSRATEVTFSCRRRQTDVPTLLASQKLSAPDDHAPGGEFPQQRAAGCSGKTQKTGPLLGSEAK